MRNAYKSNTNSELSFLFKTVSTFVLLHFFYLLFATKEAKMFLLPLGSRTYKTTKNILAIRISAV